VRTPVEPLEEVGPPVTVVSQASKHAASGGAVDQSVVARPPDEALPEFTMEKGPQPGSLGSEPQFCVRIRSWMLKIAFILAGCASQ
jgi:hypothetical protein